MTNDERALQYAVEYNQDTEFSVTGAYLLYPRIMDKLVCVLQSEDFMNPLCAKLYAAAAKAYRDGKILDPVMARDEIIHDTANPTQFIADCMKICPSGTAAEGHAEYIHAQAKTRIFKAAVDEILSTCTGDELVTGIAGVCQDLLSGKLGRSHSMGQILDKFMDSLNAPPAGRIKTGFVRTDAMLNGLRGGDLVVIAARPAVGKSVWAVNTAINVARSGKTVLLYSLEMSDEELGERIVSGQSGVPMSNVTNHKLTEPFWERITRTCQDLYELPLIINDDPRINVSKIRAEARINKNVGLIVIDYLTLMKSENRYANRNLEIGAISRDLKLLAAELDIPIIAVAQLNRSVDETGRPTLLSLRDSGEIEQNASRIIFLWNISAEDDNGSPSIKGLAVAKNRFGCCGAVQMRFVGDQMRFVEMRADEEVWSKTTPPRRRGKWEDDD